MHSLNLNWKIKSKPLSLKKEVAQGPVLKAPPPTPCVSIKQRSGSVPDVRIEGGVKEKSCSNGSWHKILIQTVSYTCKPGQKSTIDCNRKRSTSEHAIPFPNIKGGPWSAFGMTSCTSNLLHSVRQRLLNL